MESDSVVFEREDAIARLTLNRPELANAIDIGMARALMEASIRCDEDRSIRCVVLTGAGRFFCAGGDVGSFAQAGEDVALLLKELTAYLHMAISRFARMPKPLITAINGPAAGAGLSLAMLGDVALAADSAHFTPAYTRLGLSPDGGCTWLLPRLIGLRRAQDILFTNKRVSADEAASLGLVTRSVSETAFAAEVDAMARKLVEMPTPGLGHTRSLLLSSLNSSLETHLEAEARAIAQSSWTPVGRQRIAEFASRQRT